MSFTEDSKSAALCRDFYEQVRDEIIRAHNWNCAIGRKELAENSTSPAFEWEHSFALPNNCLRVIEMEDPESIFKIEGRNLLTNEAVCKIKYVKQIINPNEFDSLFVKVFYLSLAVALSYNLTETNTIKAGLMDELKDAWTDARGMDALEGDPETTAFSAWLQSRVQGYTSKFRGSYSGRW